jgi:hypothetical protein
MYVDDQIWKNLIFLTKVEQKFLKKKPFKIVKALTKNKLCTICGSKSLYQCPCKLGLRYCGILCGGIGLNNHKKAYCGINI